MIAYCNDIQKRGNKTYYEICLTKGGPYSRGREEIFDGDTLKKHILKGELNVLNLQIDKAGRLVFRNPINTEIGIQCKNYIDSILRNFKNYYTSIVQKEYPNRTISFKGKYDSNLYNTGFIVSYSGSVTFGNQELFFIISSDYNKLFYLSAFNEDNSYEYELPEVYPRGNDLKNGIMEMMYEYFRLCLQ